MYLQVEAIITVIVESLGEDLDFAFKIEGAARLCEPLTCNWRINIKHLLYINRSPDSFRLDSDYHSSPHSLPEDLSRS